MTSIFISYSRADGDAVDAILDGLTEQGYDDVFAYDVVEHGTTIGDRWERTLRSRLVAADALLVLTGPHSLASVRCTEEIVLAREHGRRMYEIVLQGNDGHPLLDAQHRLRPQGPRLPVDVLLAALREAGLGPADRSRVSSPYPGLRAFGEEHSRFFFGRASDVESIADLVDVSTLRGGALAVIGPSGVGKSSLVRAGIIPYLRSRQVRRPWVIGRPFTPGPNPLHAVASSLADVAKAVGGRGAGTSAAAIERALTTSGTDLNELIDDLLGVDDDTRVLLVLDQAEELVSVSDRVESAEIVKILRAVVDHRRAWLIYTLRSDFLTNLLNSAVAAPLVARSHLVTPLSRSDLFEVVARPARGFGWQFDPDAVAAIVDDMTDPRSLPLLAYLLEQVFRTAASSGRERQVITLDDYRRVGPVEQVLSRHAEIAFQDAVTLATAQGGHPEDDVRTVLRMLRRLVSVREDGVRTRRPVPLEQWTVDELALLAPFVETRVVTQSSAAGVEVAHEALLDGWSRLRRELDEVADALRLRSDVERRTAAWVADSRGDTGLLPGTALLALVDVVRRGSDLEPTSAAPGWELLAVNLAHLGLSDTEVAYLSRSMQGALDEELARIERELATDAARAAAALAGTVSPVQRALMDLLVDAPDLGGLVSLTHRVMAADPSHLIVDSHPGGAWGVAWAPDGTRFATGGRDQTVRIWDATPGRLGDDRLLQEMRHGRDLIARSATPGWVRSVAWTDDDEFVLSVATDQTLRLWDPRTGDELRSLPLSERLWTVHMAGRRAVTAGAEGRSRVYTVDRTMSEPDQVLPAPVRLWAAALSPDGRRVAAACENHVAYVHTLDDNTEGPLPIEHPAPVRSVGWSPDGTLVGTGCQDDVARVHDATTGALLHALTGHRDQVRAIRWSPRGHRIATASADGEVRVWDVQSGSCVRRLPGHAQGVCAVEWSTRGDLLVSVANDGTARLWKVGAQPVVAVALDGPATALAWCAAERTLAVATADNERTAPGAVWLVTPDGAGIRAEAGHALPVLSVDWSPTAGLLTGSVDRTASSWTDGRRGTDFLGARDAVVEARWSPRGDRVLAACRDRIIRLWNAVGELEADGEPELHTNFLTGAAWDRTGDRFAVVAEDHRLSVHDARTREYRMTDAGGALRCVAWNAVTDEIAVGRSDGAIFVFTVPEGLEPTGVPRELLGHHDPVLALAWSPAGGLLCAVSGDGRGTVWDTLTGAQRTVLIGHTGPVTGCVWIADDTVATCGADGTVRLWDVADGADRPTAGLPASVEPTPGMHGYAVDLLTMLRRRLGR